MVYPPTSPVPTILSFSSLHITKTGRGEGEGCWSGRGREGEVWKKKKKIGMRTSLTLSGVSSRSFVVMSLSISVRIVSILMIELKSKFFVSCIREEEEEEIRTRRSSLPSSSLSAPLQSLFYPLISISTSSLSPPPLPPLPFSPVLSLIVYIQMARLQSPFL